MGTIPDSTIDTLTVSSCGRDDVMSKNIVILLKVPFFGMVTTLQLEVAIGTSMILSEIVMLVYYKVSKPSKSVETCILIVKLCT